MRGRAKLAAGLSHAAAERAAAGEVHRHWHGMVEVQSEEADGSVLVRCYALIIATQIGGPTKIHRACVCTDILVPDGSRWLVRERRVTRDDVPSDAALLNVDSPAAGPASV